MTSGRCSRFNTFNILLSVLPQESESLNVFVWYVCHDLWPCADSAAVNRDYNYGWYSNNLNNDIIAIKPLFCHIPVCLE